MTLQIDSSIIADARNVFDANWYRINYSINGDDNSLFEHYINIGWTLGYNPSILFDQKWYLEKNSDLKQLNHNLLYHYLEFGYKESRQPSIWIDCEWFDRETQFKKYNPLIYYFDPSIKLHVDPHPLIDLKHIKEQVDETHEGKGNLLLLFLTNDLHEKVNPCQLFDFETVSSNSLEDITCVEILKLYIEGSLNKALKTHPLFDGEWYYKRYEHVRCFDGPLLSHYIKYGSDEMLTPHLLFDPIWYKENSRYVKNNRSLLESYLGVTDDGNSPHAIFSDSYYRKHLTVSIEEAPLLHYVKLRAPRAKTHQLFDGDWYLRTYPDCISDLFTPLYHYLEHGWKELRNPNSIFQESFYHENAINNRKNIPGLIDYMYFGWKLRRRANPMFDEKYYMDNYIKVQDKAEIQVFPMILFYESRSIDVNTHPDFEAKWYRDHYMRGVDEVKMPLEHFTEVGLQNSFNPAPWVDLKWYVNNYNIPVTVHNILNVIDIFKKSKDAIDHRVTSVGKGLFNFISERLGKSEKAYNKLNVYNLVSIKEIAQISFGQSQSIRESIKVRSKLPKIDAKIFVEDEEFELLFPEISVLHLYNVICRSTSRMVIYGESDRLGHDEMYHNKCPDASSKLYGISSYKKNIYMQPPDASFYIESGIHLMNEHDNNYFHWIVEMLPRISVLQKEVFAEYPVIISSSLHKNMYDLLDIVIGVKYNKIKIPDNTWFYVNDLIYPSDVTYIPDVYDRPSNKDDVLINAPELKKVRDLILQHYGKTDLLKSSGKVCYFTRKKGIRRVINEEDLISSLQKCIKMDVISSEELTIRDQVDLFSSLDVAIIPTGASMTNILWCRPGTKVICLFSNHPSLNPYLWQQLSEIAGVHLDFVTGSRLYDVTDKHSVHDNYVIDANKILSLLGDLYEK